MVRTERGSLLIRIHLSLESQTVLTLLSFLVLFHRNWGHTHKHLRVLKNREHSASTVCYCCHFSIIFWMIVAYYYFSYWLLSSKVPSCSSYVIGFWTQVCNCSLLNFSTWFWPLFLACHFNIYSPFGLVQHSSSGFATDLIRSLQWFHSWGRDRAPTTGPSTPLLAAIDLLINPLWEQLFKHRSTDQDKQLFICMSPYCMQRNPQGFARSGNKLVFDSCRNTTMGELHNGCIVEILFGKQS